MSALRTLYAWLEAKRVHLVDRMKSVDDKGLNTVETIGLIVVVLVFLAVIFWPGLKAFGSSLWSQVQQYVSGTLFKLN